MLVRNSVRFDTRVKKEAQTLASHGYRVTVIGSARADMPNEERDGPVLIRRIPRPAPLHELRRRLKRRRTKAEAGLAQRRGLERLSATSVRLMLVRVMCGAALPLVRRLPSPVYRVLKEHWAYRLVIVPLLADLEPHIVHAHDLGTLYGAEAYCRAARCPLVYDAHELELARRPKRDLLGRYTDRRIERAGILSAAAVITVSEGIARDLAQTYGISPPSVILNSPSLGARGGNGASNLREAAALDDSDVLAVYIGKVIAKKVGLEKLVVALSRSPARFHLGFLGPPPEPSVRAAIDGLALRRGVGDRLHWLGSIPYEQVPDALSTATFSVIPIQNVHRSYDLALPNKLFDSIMAGIPVGVARLQEMERIVTQHEIGVVFDERSPDAIAAALLELEELARDPGGELAARFARLQREISWERQEERLLAVYGNLVPVA